MGVAVLTSLAMDNPPITKAAKCFGPMFRKWCASSIVIVKKRWANSVPA
jgi:hypothetical protein